MLHKPVATETCINLATKIWQLRSSILLTVKQQYLMKLLYTGEVNIGIFVCGCKKKMAKSEIKTVLLTAAVSETKVVTQQPKQQMVEAKKNERADASKEVKRLCKEFGFTAGMLKGSLAEGRQPI
jgi:hypothetical protein